MRFIYKQHTTKMRDYKRKIIWNIYNKTRVRNNNSNWKHMFLILCTRQMIIAGNNNELNACFICFCIYNINENTNMY